MVCVSSYYSMLVCKNKWQCNKNNELDLVLSTSQRRRPPSKTCTCRLRGLSGNHTILPRSWHLIWMCEIWQCLFTVIHVRMVNEIRWHPGHSPYQPYWVRLVCWRIGHWQKLVWTPHINEQRFLQLLHSIAVTGCLLCLLPLAAVSGLTTRHWELLSRAIKIRIIAIIIIITIVMHYFVILHLSTLAFWLQGVF